MEKIRVRFAPSPTGFLHIGGLRTALYDYLFARKHEGDFLLRIEDTDQKRFVPNALEKFIESLHWAGLDYSEGVYLENGKVIQKGEYGPYIQSERLEIYRKYAEELIEMGHAYYCFCEPVRLEKMKEEKMKNKQAAMYDKYCLKNVSPEDVNNNLKNNIQFTIRMKVTANETVKFQDLVRGEISFETNNIDDQILIKSDGFPTYHFASVVDDHLMKISHVIRGDEWLPSTPKHVLLYRYFGWKIPQFAHLPLLLNPDKSKLSKRQGDVAVEDYIAKGYLKEAIINFVVMLGWNPGKGETQEIFSMKELIEKFDFHNVHKAGAVFDIQKLDWINAQYIKKLSIDELCEKALPFLEKEECYQKASKEKKIDEYLKKFLEVERERLNKLSEIGKEVDFFFCDIEYDGVLLKWKVMTSEEIKKSLEKCAESLEKISSSQWTKENLERELLECAGEKRGELLWPLRVALTGKQKSPSPFEVAWVLGKEESLKRIQKAIEK
jgi:glutamyl-tRNA synthetase